MGESHPPRFPNVFISPATEPEYSWPMSMHAAQNVTEANMLSPAAAARSRMAVTLLEAWAPSHSKIAEENIPTQTARRCPRRRPNLRTAKSENNPPRGEAIAMARYGVAP